MIYNGPIKILGYEDQLQINRSILEGGEDKLAAGSLSF